MDSLGPVDWDTAASVARRLSRPGPRAGRDQLDELVGQLRESATRAAVEASRTTRLVPADGRPPQEVSRVLVVDRAGWARANAQMFAVLAGPLTEPLAGPPAEPLGGAPVADDAPVPSAGSRRSAGMQVGAGLAFLSGKVLGQFDPFTPPVPPGGGPRDPLAPGEGRLLLVAPNVLHLERVLGVDPADFRLWVALHEQTHALQFAAAPWLAPHLRARFSLVLANLVGGTEPDASGDLAERFSSLVERAVQAVTKPDGSVLDALSDEQRVVVDEVGAVMSLLEGHADVAMDAVGRRVVPSVRQIRAKFEARRDSAARKRGAAGLLRRLLGMDAKLAQYRDGADFVRHVRGAVGLTGFNAVWESVEHLPTPAEIEDPAAWVRRVHG
ncbi:zinc-dependent metalloprotease [Cellulomonas composti]|uniref:Hydrolase n=1 Tax=Cellulomonas composti TaxID=266130 RepID=A0A511JBA4_9CELL|nr:zinc-dependent metalloprotease [Cellulomonas composti]GEL95254.1 hypothetical protein CCO02nite_19120 [Cellulomonas composti]